MNLFIGSFLAASVLISSSVVGQLSNHTRSRLDTLSGFLVLRFDSCYGAWQYVGAQLISRNDTIPLSMMPAFYDPVYARNQQSNKWIKNHIAFESGRRFIKDSLLSGIYDRSSTYSYGLSMDASNGLVQYGKTQSINKSVMSPSIYSNSEEPRLHRYIVLRSELVLLSISTCVFDHINADEDLPVFDLACYPEMRTSHTVIHKFLSTTNCTESSIEDLGLVHTNEDQFTLIVYE